MPRAGAAPAWRRIRGVSEPVGGGSPAGPPAAGCSGSSTGCARGARARPTGRNGNPPSLAPCVGAGATAVAAGASEGGEEFGFDFMEEEESPAAAAAAGEPATEITEEDTFDFGEEDDSFSFDDDDSF